MTSALGSGGLKLYLSNQWRLEPLAELVGGLTSLEEIMLDALLPRGIYFRVQVPTSSGFVLDFLVNDRVVIEVDGPCHNSSKARKRDRFRDRILKSQGYEVHRLSYKNMQTPESVNQWLDSVLGPPL